MNKIIKSAYLSTFELVLLLLTVLPTFKDGIFMELLVVLLSLVVLRRVSLLSSVALRKSNY